MPKTLIGGGVVYTMHEMMKLLLISRMHFFSLRILTVNVATVA
jgi:hypothetical protein